MKTKQSLLITLMFIFTINIQGVTQSYKKYLNNFQHKVDNTLNNVQHQIKNYSDQNLKKYGNQIKKKVLETYNKYEKDISSNVTTTINNYSKNTKSFINSLQDKYGDRATDVLNEVYNKYGKNAQTNLENVYNRYGSEMGQILLDTYKEYGDQVAEQLQQSLQKYGTDVADKIYKFYEKYDEKTAQKLHDVYNKYGKETGDYLSQMMAKSYDEFIRYASDPAEQQKVINTIVHINETFQYVNDHKKEILYSAMKYVGNNIYVEVNGKAVNMSQYYGGWLKENAPFLEGTDLAEDPAKLITYGLVFHDSEYIVNDMKLVPSKKGGYVSIKDSLIECSPYDAESTITILNAVDGFDTLTDENASVDDMIDAANNIAQLSQVSI